MASTLSGMVFMEVAKLGFAPDSQPDKGVEAAPCPKQEAEAIFASGMKPPKEACASQGFASDRVKAKAESLWQNYFKDPTGWWDNRKNKLHAKSPDFRHKSTRAVLWIDDPYTPQWVAEALRRNEISPVAARSSFSEMGSSLDGEWRPRDVRTSQRNEDSWMALILQHTKCEQYAQALRVYDDMQKDGVEPSPQTVVAILKACSSLQDLETAKRIHVEVARRGMESNLYVGTMLVDVYAKCRSLVDARHAFDNISHRDVVSWNAMIVGYAQMDKGEEALQLYTRMQHEGVAPDTWTYVSTLKACGSLAGSGENPVAKEYCLQTVRTIHANIVKAKFELDEFVGTTLVDVYAKCGSLEDARHVFEKMLHRDVVCWTAMISGYTQMDMAELALQLYAQMEMEGVVPDDRTYVSALKACSTLVAADSRNGGHGISVKQKCLDIIRGIHGKVKKAKLESDAFVGNMLVDVYAKCGRLEDARRVFENMPDQSVMSWTAMICGYAQMDEGDLALELYTRMQQEGVVPNERTYVGVLNACGTMAGLEKGKEIHSQILKAGLAVDSFVTDSLISMYGKCGSMTDAQQVFDAMPTKGIVAWNALIAGYAQQGQNDHVFDLFRRMKQEGLQPDSITFLGLLTACSHAGLVDQGHMYFKVMSRDYGITSAIKHFTCMIDLLGRAGQLDKAMEMVETMPCQPHSAVFRCLLGACQKWGAVELGRRVFEWAVRAGEGDSAPYVLMSNIYLAAQMREEAKTIQAMRAKSGAWKQPGQSRWTDLHGITHVFVVGDHGHPESGAIYAELADLWLKMKDGYAVHLGSLFQDIPTGEEVGAVCGHTESLVIAQSYKIPQKTKSHQ